MKAAGRSSVWVAILLLFFALRVPLLITREPFFDELATVWYAKQPLAQQWALLAEDSLSPLLPLLARLGEVVFGFDVTSGRLLSLGFGLATLALVFLLREEHRIAAATALAAFPPHVFFSTEARAYALAALLTGLAAATLYRWHRGGGRGNLAAAVVGLVLAAYSHGYGVLFLPLPFLLSLFSRDRRRIAEGFAASAAAGVLFLPGLWLASVQPPEAIEWMRLESLLDRMKLIGRSLLQLGFAAEYKQIFLRTPPLWMRLASAAIVAVVTIAGLRKSETARWFGAFTVVPIVAVFVFAAAGKTFYYPTRFESLLALPFACLLAAGLAVLPRPRAVAALAALVAMATFVAWRSAGHHADRPLPAYRTAARVAVEGPPLPIVASGYAYLEAVSAAGSRTIIAFPAEQARHPGWVRRADGNALAAELPRLPERFIWIGVDGTVEAQALRRRFALQPAFRDRSVIAAVAEAR